MVKVTKADREAAAQFCIDLTGDITGKAPKILRGECDDWTEVQAFAHARIAGAKAALEMAAEVADGYHERTLEWAKKVRGLRERLSETDSSRIAADIRNIDPEECE